MSTQVNYVCWTAEDVTATIPTEAATPSPDVLLATHTPLRITRQGARASHAETELIDEHQVLDEFLNSEPTNGVLVATILGESGTGKSHLVRWADAKIDRKPGRHVIYLRKTDTSLKNVVEQLLVDQKGPEFDDIRSKLASLGSGVTQETMEGRILDALAEALENHEATGAAKALIGADGLALFFRDPLFREHLLRPGSFVKRRAKHALYGRDADEPDVPLEFTVDELPLDIVDYANIADAAAKTRRIFTRLTASAQLQVDGVGMINDLLDVAVTRAASLGIGDVGHAFLRMRENLIDDEIILLIEDVALIQGVRRDLLDAIVDPGVDQGVKRYATIRTMMAVTSGYYNGSLPETFRYRAEATSPLYQVDVDLASDAADDELLIDFVGRYLNAARVGKTRLEAASPQVPNACTSCSFRASCHESFEASGDGYGLWPYNRPAILRAISTLADRRGNRRMFNPRRVLARAVRDTLNDGGALIESGEFPPGDFLGGGRSELGLPTLSLGVRARIEEHYGERESGRLQTLLTFWGDSGRARILPGVLTAFSHEPIPDSIFEDSEEPEHEPRPEGAGRKPGPSTLRKLEAIDRWSAGTANLPPGLAGELRGTIREALIARLDWYDTVIKEPNSDTLKKALPTNARGISIQGATENIQNANPVLVVPRNARMGQMFSGLVLLEAGFAERTGEALPRLDALVAPAVGELRRRIFEVMEVDDTSLTEAAASLLRGAAACGQLPTQPTDVDLLNGVFWANVAYQRTDRSVRRLDWLEAYDTYVAARGPAVKRLLEGVGAAQGLTGDVYALDVKRLLPLVRNAWKMVKEGGTLVVPAWCKDADRKANALVRAAAPQIAHWQSLVDRVRLHLPAGVRYLDTVAAITEAAKAGGDLGLVKVADLPGLASKHAAAREYDASGIVAVEKVLSELEGADDYRRLALVGTEVGADLDQIADFLDASAGWVAAGLAEATTDGVTVTDLDTELHEATETWLGIIAQMGEEGDAGAEPEDGMPDDAAEAQKPDDGQPEDDGEGNDSEKE